MRGNFLEFSVPLFQGIKQNCEENKCKKNFCNEEREENFCNEEKRRKLLQRVKLEKSRLAVTDWAVSV